MKKQVRKCQHQENSCRTCSRVKMVVYLKNGDQKVWYSFIKEESKHSGNTSLARSMGERVERFYDGQVSKMLWYDNQNVKADAFLEN